jgi:hypothetical protein
VYSFCALVVDIFKNKRFFYDFFPKILTIGFLFACALVFSLAWQADFNIHPDESAHIESTEYYQQYWLPPKVGDSANNCCTSRLNLPAKK